MRIKTGFMDDSYGENTVEGYVMTFGKDGKNFELFAMGQRNPVGADFNKDGEFFTYDSDMEWDMGDPWYRPTNVQHIVSGADFGFRNGSRKHPQWQFDLTPYVAEVGAGSPVGFGNGVGLKFPARYQDAMFAGDWSYGYLHSTFLTPKGSSYEAVNQVFIEGRPFPVTGITVNKADGSMIVLTGGRAQTQVYRVTYTGSESTAPSGPDTKFAADRRQRQALEKFHGKQDPTAVKTLWSYLGDSDRFMRYAARVALEWQDKKTWTDQALAETDPRRSMAAIVALARVSGKDVYSTVPGKTPAPDKALQAKMFAALDRIDPRQITFQEKLDLLRSYGLVMIRLGAPDEATRQRLIAKFDPMLPSMQRELNWELADMLAYLDAPSVPQKVMALLRNAPAAANYFPIREWANQQLRTRQDQGGQNGKTLPAEGRPLGARRGMGLGRRAPVPGFTRLCGHRAGVSRQRGLWRTPLQGRLQAMGAGDAGRRHRCPAVRGQAGLGGPQAGLHHGGELRRLCGVDGRGQGP